MGIKFIGRTAFDEVYREYADIVYRIALHFSGNQSAAEEITQEVFLKLYIHMENIDVSKVGAWLKTTTKHVAMNYKRDNSREILVGEILYSEDESRAAPDMDRIFLDRLRKKENEELADSILAELYKVNPRWYDALTITYVLGKSEKEVAAEMGMTPDALYSMIRRAKNWIRKRYEEEYDRVNKA